MMTTNELQLVEAVLADTDEIAPARPFGYDYVVAANGLFIRAEDKYMLALVPVAMAICPGLQPVEPYARLKVERISSQWLASIYNSARRAMPAEAMYQFVRDPAARNSHGGWACVRPQQKADPLSVNFLDVCTTTVDLHSHNSMGAFFSGTDNADEQGFRFYCVIGRIDTLQPEIAVRAGVYGHHWPVPALTIFDGLGPFCEKDHADEQD